MLSAELTPPSTLADNIQTIIPVDSRTDRRRLVGPCYNAEEFRSAKDLGNSMVGQSLLNATIGFLGFGRVSQSVGFWLIVYAKRHWFIFVPSSCPCSCLGIFPGFSTQPQSRDNVPRRTTSIYLTTTPIHLNRPHLCRHWPASVMSSSWLATSSLRHGLSSMRTCSDT